MFQCHVKIASSGIPDGGLRDNLHHVPGLLARAGQGSGQQAGHDVPGAVQGPHQGQVADLQDLLRLDPHQPVPRWVTYTPFWAK